jgi:hypothetical protein
LFLETIERIRNTDESISYRFPDGWEYGTDHVIMTHSIYIAVGNIKTFKSTPAIILEGIIAYNIYCCGQHKDL